MDFFKNKWYFSISIFITVIFFFFLASWSVDFKNVSSLCPGTPAQKHKPWCGYYFQIRITPSYLLDGLFIDPTVQPEICMRHMIALSIWNRATLMVALFSFCELIFITRKRITENFQKEQDESQKLAGGLWLLKFEGRVTYIVRWLEIPSQIMNKKFWCFLTVGMLHRGSYVSSIALQSCTNTHFLQNRLSVISWNKYLL